MLKSSSATAFAMDVRELRKEYPGVVAVDGISFQVPAGSIHGFLGPNGAGKSTTIRMLAGLLAPTQGRASVLGLDPVNQGLALKSRLGLLPEQPPLYLDMTVREYLSFVAKLHGVAEVPAAVDRVAALTGLAKVLGRLIGNLSKGYRQRVGIAQALVHDPELIILDEPTAGLDPESVVEIRQLVKSLRGHKTVLFSSHLLHEVEEVCDGVTIIAQGKLVAHGTLAEVRARVATKRELRLRVRELSSKLKAQLEGLASLSSLQVEASAAESVAIQLQFSSSEEFAPAVARLVVAEGGELLELASGKSALEDIFLSLLRQGGRP